MPEILNLERLSMLSLWLCKLWWQLNRRRIKSWFKRTKHRLPRRWKAKSPEACPHRQAGIHLHRQRKREDVEPWCNRKSRRGAKKQIDTAGFACLNPTCLYFGIREASVQALVG